MGTPAIGYVYRAYDKYGVLLYVGCSQNVRQRMGTHRSSKSPWVPFFDRVTIEGPFDRQHALDLEELAINSEAPHFNVPRSDIDANLANRYEAQRRLIASGINRLMYDEYHDEWWTTDNWYELLNEMRERIRPEFPFTTHDDRMARYLETRELRAA